MKRRMIGLFLTLALCLGLAVHAFAAPATAASAAPGDSWQDNVVHHYAIIIKDGICEIVQNYHEQLEISNAISVELFANITWNGLSYYTDPYPMPVIFASNPAKITYHTDTFVTGGIGWFIERYTYDDWDVFWNNRDQFWDGPGSNWDTFGWRGDESFSINEFSQLSDTGQFCIPAGTEITLGPGVYSFGARGTNCMMLIVRDSASVPADQPSSWAAEQVNTAIAAGLVPASLQSKYTQAITRAEFCTLAVALYENKKGEITGRSTFTDTTDVNVQKAAFIGVVTGMGEGRFDPNAALTREQAAVMLARLAQAAGGFLEGGMAAYTYADSAEISTWAYEGIGMMQVAGIMGGVGDNKFAPKAPYTREQSMMTVLRLYEFLK